MFAMPTIWSILQLACLVCFITVAGLTIRWVVRRSLLLGGILITGTVVHVAVAALLFSISWLDLPVLRGLHTGDGFWALAPDARMYFDTAAKASEQGLHAIPYGSASPSFVSTIAVWMDLIGVNPASPLVFNLFLYVITCGLIVRFGVSSDDGAPATAAVWPLAALSFSPTLLFCSAQVLKDLMFACLTVGVALSARELLTRLDRQSARSSLAAIAGGIIGLFVGVYAIAGIRAYYAVFIWLSLALTFGLFVFRRRRVELTRYLGVTAGTLAVLWMAFMLGAGAYYKYYQDVAVGSVNMVTGGVLSSTLNRLSQIGGPAAGTAAPAPSAGQAVDSLREGFVLSAGQTNLYRRPAPGSAVPGSPAASADSAGPSWVDRLMDRASAVALGVTAMFVPISLLQAMSIVDIEGGRGFLYVTDLDTIFIDATILGIGLLLYRERRALRHRQVYLCFCLVIAILSTVLLAYVVTNLGTLFRLRLIALVPFWMAPLSISSTASRVGVEVETPVTREAPRDPALSPV
jgi:hypothetical protein